VKSEKFACGNAKKIRNLWTWRALKHKFVDAGTTPPQVFAYAESKFMHLGSKDSQINDKRGGKKTMNFGKFGPAAPKRGGGRGSKEAAGAAISQLWFYYIGRGRCVLVLWGGVTGTTGTTGTMGAVPPPRAPRFTYEKKPKTQEEEPISPPKILISPYFWRFPSPKSDSQPAAVAVSDLGRLGGDPRHLEVVHLEDPTPRDVDVGGLGDVDDGCGLGARDVVEVGFVSAVETGLEREVKWRGRRVKTTRGVHGVGQPPAGGGGVPQKSSGPASDLR